MRVTKGSSIIQTMDSIISAKKQFNVWEDNPTLLVEGKDDVALIKLYYHMKENDLPYDVILPSDEEDGSNGKKRVFEAYDKYKGEFSNLICLVDRDYDFLISENRDDPKIHYYHFFELENYIFEDSILRIMFARYFACDNPSDFNLLKNEMEEVMKIFHPYFHLCYFRELHYRKKVDLTLDRTQISKLKSILQIKPDSILNHHKYKQLSDEMKIAKYYNEELEDVNLSLKEIYGSMDYNYGQVSADIEETEPLAFFKYFISGKHILSTLMYLMKSFKNGTYEKTGDKLSLEDSLKREWIPNRSVKFEQLIISMERQLIT